MKLYQLNFVYSKVIAFAMIVLLIFLTLTNLFHYDKEHYANQNNSHPITNNSEVPSGEISELNLPVGPDEKTPDSAPQVSEEYIHDETETGRFFKSKLLHSLLYVNRSIPAIHFDLITPPPDFI